MFSFNFGRKVRRIARRQFRHGKIDRETFEKIKKGSRDPKIVAKWKSSIEQGVYGAPWLRKSGFDWREIFNEIWQWFLENWPTILKLLLTALMFVEEPPEQEEEENEDSE